MKRVIITVEDGVYNFYRKVGENVGVAPDKVMADALFKLAGELSLNAIHKKNQSKNLE